MATVAEWDTIIAALEAELLASAAAPEEFETSAPGGGKVRVKAQNIDGLMKKLRLAKRARWMSNGGKMIEPQSLGQDVDLTNDNEDGIF